MRRIIIIGALALTATACTPGLARHQVTIRPSRPVCESTEIDGVGNVVTFMWNDTITCDVTGGQVLNLVFDQTYDPHWGSDASVARAAAECDDMGGRQVWINNGNYRLICENVNH